MKTAIQKNFPQNENKFPFSEFLRNRPGDFSIHGDKCLSFNLLDPRSAAGPFISSSKLVWQHIIEYGLLFSRRKPGLVLLEFELFCLGSLVLAYSPRRVLLWCLNTRPHPHGDPVWLRVKLRGRMTPPPPTRPCPRRPLVSCWSPPVITWL